MLFKKLFFIPVLLCLNSLLVFSQAHWESIVQASDSFYFLEAITEPPVNWKSITYNDSSWKSGPGGFGYGDNDDSTIVDTVNSLYLRKTFTILNADSVLDLILYMDYDDAFVAYINGVEIGRSSNLTDPVPKYNSTLTIDREATGSFEWYNADNKLLITGENILTIQIINMSITSSDLSSLIFLLAEINADSIIYNATPNWFTPPDSYKLKSNLPIIIIDNNGKAIPDDPRDIAIMKVINTLNDTNSTDSKIFEYNGRISIERRGSSSQFFFPKNSFSLETQTDSGTNNNVSLLGMPKENDWILYAPYSDKTFIRNSLAYYLANKTGRWSPRTMFCELIVNDDYRGVYVLTEKIKRDKNRLNIAKLTTNDNGGDSVTGGYILKIDRGDDYWVSPFKTDGKNVHINYHYPKADEITIPQKEYIRKHITGFETALNENEFDNPETGYAKYIHIESFVDFYLLNEFSRNVDAYILSTFFYKDKDSKDHRIIMGPFWDYNLAYGNADYRFGFDPEGWVVKANEPAPFWFNKLRTDPYFESDLKKRWTEIRLKWLNEEGIFKFTDSLATVLSQAKERNYTRWPIIGQKVWPNYFIGNSYEEELTFMKGWISERLVWMDKEIDKIELLNREDRVNLVEDLYLTNNSVKIKVYPNPFYEELYASILSERPNEIQISLYSTTGQLVLNQKIYSEAGIAHLTLDTQKLKDFAGMLIYRISVNDKIYQSGTLIKQ